MLGTISASITLDTKEGIGLPYAYCCNCLIFSCCLLALDVVGPVDLTIYSNTPALVKGSSADIGAQPGVLLPELVGNLFTFGIVLSISVLDPGTGRGIEAGLNGMTLSQQLLLLGGVLHAVVLASNGRDVLVLPVIETLVMDDGETFAGDDLVQLGVIAGEDELGGDDGIKEGLDQLPESPEDEGCAVDNADSEGLGVIRLEALDEQTDETPIHVVEAEVRQVKDNNNCLRPNRKHWRIQRKEMRRKETT